MHNVDTTTLIMNFRKPMPTVKEQNSNKLNWKYIFNINSKIISKCKLYAEDKKVRDKLQKEINASSFNEFLMQLPKKYNGQTYRWHSQNNELTFNYNEIWQCLLIFVPHEIIANHLATEILDYVEQTIMNYFEFSKKDLCPLALFRIDIKNDFYYQDDEELEIIKNIISKMPDKIYSSKKIIFKDNLDGYCAKFISKKASSNETLNIKNKRKKSNYEETVMYDKSEQIIEKIKNKKAPKEYEKIYKNIFRTEVRIKNDKLNYLSSNQEISKELSSYYNFETTYHLYNQQTEKIFSIENFFRIDIAKKIIAKTTDITPTTKTKLKNLITLINKYGISKAKEKYGRTNFYNHIKKIKELGINPITFDKVIKNKQVSKEYILNFTNLKNGVSDPFEYCKV